MFDNYTADYMLRVTFKIRKINYSSRLVRRVTYHSSQGLRVAFS